MEYRLEVRKGVKNRSEKGETRLKGLLEKINEIIEEI